MTTEEQLEAAWKESISIGAIKSAILFLEKMGRPQEKNQRVYWGCAKENLENAVKRLEAGYQKYVENQIAGWRAVRPDLVSHFKRWGFDNCTELAEGEKE